MSVAVLFLDFDGVLNCKEFFATEAHHESEEGALDPVAVERVNQIVAATGAVVVVSSSWRHGRTLDELTGLLQRRGFVGDVYGKTADYDDVWTQRGDEIHAWLKEHPEVSRYVVLDDDNDMDAVRARFIQTDMHGGGLLDAHVVQAIAMLRGDGETASNEDNDDGG